MGRTKKDGERLDAKLDIDTTRNLYELMKLWNLNKTDTVCRCINNIYAAEKLGYLDK